MKFIYRFKATTARKRTVSALIASESRDYTYRHIQQMGFTQPEVQLDPIETLKEWFGATINPRELSRFYTTLGERLKNGGDLLQLLEDAPDYLLDGRLKSAVAIFAAGIEEGRPPGDAMRAAGFERRETMVIAALSQAAQLPQAFIDLGREVGDRYRLAQQLKSVFRSFTMMLGVAYAFLLLLVTFIAPRMMHFIQNFASLGVELPGFAQAFYAFVAWCQAHPLPAAVLYLSAPVALVYAVRSRLAAQLVDEIRPVRRLNDTLENAALWGAFGVMYAVGIPPEDIFDTLASTVKREGTRVALLRAAKATRAGREMASVVEGVGFAPRVVANFRSAAKSGELAKGLAQFARDLKSDAELMTQRLKENAEFTAQAMMGALVIGMFMVTIYPIFVPLANQI